MDWLAEDREEVVGLVVDYFGDSHGLYLGAGRHTECGDLRLNEVTYIRIVPVIFAGHVVIFLGLALGWNSIFRSRHLLVESDFRCSSLECR